MRSQLTRGTGLALLLALLPLSLAACTAAPNWVATPAAMTTSQALGMHAQELLVKLRPGVALPKLAGITPLRSVPHIGWQVVG
ncbi:MAG TPA: hypothetical protein V6D47_07650, partial [Oscillatoriaceae cyanobacterium]